MDENSYQHLIKACERHLALGQSPQVAKLLTGLNCAQVKRQWVLPLAQLARELGLINLGLKLLSPHTEKNHSTKSTEPASEAEKLEYANLLLASGAVAEAIDRMHEINTKLTPEVLLSQGIAALKNWDNKSSVQYLEKYLEVGSKKEKARLLLAQALLHSGLASDALVQLNQLREDINEKQEVLVLRGKIYLLQNDFDAARNVFEKISKVEAKLTRLKWLKLVEAVRRGDKSIIEEVRSLCREPRDGAGLRDADYFSLRIKFEPEVYHQLYFGSPLGGYRAFLEKEFGPIEKKHFILNDSAGPFLDLHLGKRDGKIVLRPGRQAHKVLDVLTRDLYEPISIAKMYSLLFPGESFSIKTSAHRVHQVVLRARQEFACAQLPIEIKEFKGFYSLEFTGLLAIKLPKSREPLSIANLQLLELKDRFPDEPFTAREAQLSLQMSGATVHRLLSRALRDGKLENFGHKGSGRYKIKDSNPNQST